MHFCICIWIFKYQNYTSEPNFNSIFILANKFADLSLKKPVFTIIKINGFASEQQPIKTNSNILFYNLNIGGIPGTVL